jgi:flagellar hook protein FlgE
MSFQTGLSGLNASSKNLDVIGHNIANANTSGMKASRAEFSEMYASALGAAGGANSGIGVQVAAVTQLFTQGNIKVTGNQLDLAINGSGFFQVQTTDGSTLYTRNGEFKLDKEGYIITNTGARLQGFPTDEAGNRTSVVPADILLPTGAAIDPRATGTGTDVDKQGVSITANLDARATTLGAPLAPVAPATTVTLTTDQKKYGTAFNAYDSQGNAIPVQLYFVRVDSGAVSTTAEWQGLWSIDGGQNATSMGTVTFGVDGKVTANNLTTDISIAGGSFASGIPSNDPLSFPINIEDADGNFTLTQYGANFAVYDLSQDGYPSGELTSIDIGEDGVILARYSNGVSQAEGQVALGNFRNLQGLQPVNGGYWSETFASGPVVLGGPQEGRLGLVRQSSLEDSNVDMTQELVNMIVAQRAYQANAQTIKTQDQVQQTLVNLR